MNPDLAAIAARLDAEPRDALAISALADLLEERGADPAIIRALTVDGPTVLVFGVPNGVGSEEIEAIAQVARDATQWLIGHSSHPIKAIMVGADVTIRKITVNQSAVNISTASE